MNINLKNSNLFCLVTTCLLITQVTMAQQDTLAIHWVGHGSVYFEYENRIIHVDPNSSIGNYANLPDADLICITHGHGDHYDVNALNQIKTDSTLLIYTQEVKNFGTYSGNIQVMKNWDDTLWKGIGIKAVPAYNIPDGQIYHPKGAGNGYIFTFNQRTVYVAGDTENFPEMDSLGQIDIAFLPMNLPYTMTPEQAADAAKRIRPHILYIYHFGNSDTAKFRNLLKDEPIEVRIGESLRYESTTAYYPTKIIAEKELQNRVLFYPNPAKEQLSFINTENYRELCLINAIGKTVMVSPVVQGKNQLNIGHLPRGNYLLQLRNNQSVSVNSVVIL